MKKSTFLALLFTAGVLFTGCFDPIFNNILQDVPPEEATVSGNITAITRYNAGKEFLVLAADGGLRYKPADANTHGCWDTYPYSSLPFTAHQYSYYDRVHYGQQIIKVLADETYLYLFTVSYKEDEDAGTSVPEKFYLWAKQITSTGNKWNEYSGNDGAKGWVNIAADYKHADGSDLFWTYTYNDYYYSTFNVFGSNSVKPEHRVVYIRARDASDDDSGYVYLKVNGNNKLTSADKQTIDSSKVIDGSVNKINSVQYLNGDYYFANTSATATNETKDKDATVIYFGGTGEDDYLYYYDTEKHQVVDAGENPSCFAVTKDALIIGRADLDANSTNSGGLVKVSLDSNGIPGKTLVDFTTNATSQIPSYYLVYTLLTADPSQNELDAAIYASIGFKTSGSSASVSYDNVGLWSYYKDRGNWNRE